ncbi:selenocysteine-specific translation elongation factor [uncultured Pseudoflavonifractor sp.]|uniref:selenocysteine-specific translation elongation factor n=1 Tax=uncultured Pseudoflavonifractor sp. TaxID=1221379 RepID=UPI0025EC9B7F|nr:selenocysteine-specific translation elongation factor [uncultured Pseudoflavonifractor sp.]
MNHLILAVAGHVDHGKTALVKALTGTDTDTLAEEKRRGLTIEPGFAVLSLPGGGEADLVDVPGHEKFIRNMLSGAAGADGVLLTVAAVEGVMPQTREHLALCALLGMEAGVVAVTKADLADESRLTQVKAAVAALTAGTFLEGAPVVPVSSRTGLGLDELRAAVASLSPRRRRTDLPFRLEVDRLFSLQGRGTVAAGTVAAGQVAAGDTLALYPGHGTVRVRGLQRHGAEAERLEAGSRAALLLSGETDSIRKGDTLAAPGSMALTDRADVTLTLLADAPFSVKHGAQLHLHHGAAALLCRCVFFDRTELLPGQTCFAQLRLSAPMAARVGDRFVVRFFSPVATIGGGVLLDLSPHHKKKDPGLADRLAALASPDPLRRMAAALAGQAVPSAPEALAMAAGLSQAEGLAALEALAREEKAIPLGTAWLSAQALEALAGRAAALLDGWHAARPLEPGMVEQLLCARLLPDGGAPSEALAAALEGQGVLRRRNGLVFRPGFRPRYTPELAKVRDRLEVLYRRAGLEAPEDAAVEAAFGPDASACRQVMTAMTRQGILVPLGEGCRIHRRPLERARALLLDLFQDSPALTLARFRDRLGVSRKYALLLLEHWDSEGLTRREGNYRVLRRENL